MASSPDDYDTMQVAFWLRTAGWTFQQIADRLDLESPAVAKAAVQRWWDETQGVA